MADTSSTNRVSPFHSLENETVKQGTDNWNNTRNNPEISPLKALANMASQRNKARNNHETRPSNNVSSPCAPETKQTESFSLPLNIGDYEERVAIAEYDGSQDACQAHRIAYQDAIFTLLVTNLPDNNSSMGGDWFMERIKTAQGFLMAQGILQPE